MAQNRLTGYLLKQLCGGKKQTMLINEKKMNMMNPDDRKFLEGAMVDFLFEGKDIHIEGYKPPTK